MWQSGPSIPLASSTVYSYTHSKNGLKVLLCPVQDANACAYMRAVSAGSKDEASCVPMGSAHFIEHMSFRIQKGKIWKLASKGDVINAETSMDSTRFYVVHLPHQTSQTIQIDADRFKQSSVPSDKVHVELNAVINELERGEQAGNKMFQTTSALGIVEHPYHHSTIGTRFDVMSTTALDMEHFRTKYYVPNNTTLIFCGAMDPQLILADVDKHFGSMEAAKIEHVEHTPEPPQYGKRTAELCIEAPCPMICMAFRQPMGSTKESIVLQCISRLTWHNKEGRAKVLLSSGTLHDISTYAPRQKNPYLWFFHGTLESNGNLQEAETKMFHVLQSFSTHSITKDELNKVKNSLSDDWSRSMESVTDMMSELGRGVSLGNWKDTHDRQLALESITPQDVETVAALVFRKQHMTVTHVKPTSVLSKMCTSTAFESSTSTISPAVPPQLIPTKEGAWKIKQLSPTTNILHVPRASYVRVTLSARFSPAQHDIASLLVSNMGAGNGKTISSQLTALHTDRNFSHDHEFVHMTMEMPTNPNILTEASDIMFRQEWLRPTFTKQFVEQQKHHLIVEMNSLKKDQAYLTKSHFIQALFERTLYHTPLEVRTKRIRKLTTHDLTLFHNTWIRQPQTMVTIVTPSIDAAAVLGKILPAHEKLPDTTLEWLPKPRIAVTKHIETPGYGSFQIMLGQTVPVKQYSRQAVALQCAAEILGGGMTGRLMHTVREQRGLGTYGLYAVMQHISTKTDAIFCIQGTFSPSSVKEGLKCTKELLQDWHTHGVTPQELENVKERILGSRTIAADSVDKLHGMVLQYLLQKKQPAVAIQEFSDTLQSLTLQEVNDTITNLVDINAMTEIITGPP